MLVFRVSAQTGFPRPTELAHRAIRRELRDEVRQAGLHGLRVLEREEGHDAVVAA